jgi:hypothetical protein
VVMAEKRLSASSNGSNEKRTGEVHLAIVRTSPLDTGSAVTWDGSRVQNGKQGLKAEKNWRFDAALKGRSSTLPKRPS